MTVSHGDRELAEENTIWRALVGSQAHGTNVAGTDDRDEMGIAVEPRTHVLGLYRFDQWLYRTAEHEGSRSGPGDLDLVIYGLQKYMRLAAAGNPSVLALLFCPNPIVWTPQGKMLQDAAGALVSRDAGARFLGYLTSQRDKMLGTRGNRTNRPELIEQYGFDTKFAGHAVRLGYQGVEFLTTGRMTLPMPEDIRSWIVALRTGGHTQADALERIEDYRAQIETLMKAPDMPRHADKDALSDVMEWVYQSWWDR